MNHISSCCPCEGCNYFSDNYWFPILTHLQVDWLVSVGKKIKKKGAPTSLASNFLKIHCLCRYFIDRHTDLERQFNINVDDGKITLAKPLDRETDMWHNITVTATEVSKLLLLTQQAWQTWELQGGSYQRCEKQASATALTDLTAAETRVHKF